MASNLEPAGPRLEAARLYEEAHIRRSEGNVTGAFARYRRVLEIAEELEDQSWKAALLEELGEMYREAFELPDARRWYSHAVALFRELGDRAAAGRILFRSAQVEQLAGSVERAEELFREALDTLRDVGEPATEGLARAALGHLFWDLGRVEEGGAEVAAGLRLLQESDPRLLEQALEQVRGRRADVGAVRHRQLVASLAAAGVPPELLPTLNR
jgi:tetratricopeptide (TPR) repeat protein